ncbi:oxidoreductase [Prochlorococcus sp. MIT 1307]|uniref:oxidoreductase n=1 Tax=Prochlorococcus sp. MIT 1307 TaxID=3096219 RepID=UPI002A7603F2|nr:oxidoreductase [Prochlorococcus sp. MIT 1307]
MSWDLKDIPNQTGRLVLVTGANSGLGFETCKALIKKNATVILGCRSLEKAQIARNELLRENEAPKVDLLEIDLADLRAVNLAADQLRSKYGYLDILINNAGIMAPPRNLSKQGLEIQFAVNHLAHMALTNKLLPLLAKRSGARVVTVTSGAQYMGKIAWDDLQGEENYDRWASYSQSKLANVMFAFELENRLRETKSQVASLLAHPGLARTNLQATSISESGSWLEAFAYKLLDPMFQTARMGALPQLLAATSQNAKGGEQYGPRFNLRGYPKVCPLAPIALESRERKRLWEVSEKLISFYSVK